MPDGDVGSPRDVIAVADALRRAAHEIAPRATTLTHVVPSSAAPAVIVDLPARQVLIQGVDIDLSYSEFEVLAQLVRRPRSVVARSELLTLADATESLQSAGRRIDVHVSRIRAKLGRYATMVSTVRGAGYRFDPDRRIRVVDTAQDATARLTA
ncbi:winged helix-turn-helix transcriptional regulator [Antrihabitans cavernicola]|uniref:Winged helix-turn-helix transcriptional regulator n=2 Tax=Antrihabitans cavernicola TaxID=2495913 RepID=A0A5A7SJT2_9NOCA|nr:winged helix-turn-helix transcriptional regulator [Spelaeibacter cavernicola]